MSCSELKNTRRRHKHQCIHTTLISTPTSAETSIFLDRNEALSAAGQDVLTRWSGHTAKSPPCEQSGTFQPRESATSDAPPSGRVQSDARARQRRPGAGIYLPRTNRQTQSDTGGCRAPCSPTELRTVLSRARVGHPSQRFLQQVHILLLESKGQLQLFFGSNPTNKSPIIWLPEGGVHRHSETIRQRSERLSKDPLLN